MNAPVSRSSAILLMAGALAVLLLGAFARVDSGTPSPTVAPTQSEAVAPLEAAGEIQLPPGLSPGLAEIIRMAQAHVDENVIAEYIRSSGVAYAPTADELLYLSDLGLSQTTLAALFPQKKGNQPEVAQNTSSEAPISSASSAPSTPSTIATPTAAETASGLFYNELAPYGSWTQVPNYGLCWQPAAEIVNPDWRPYVDNGQWQSTDNGWYWQSGYSWGWAVFHYGRWTLTKQLGWVWVPDNVWGPAWVSWRVALNHTGWAPLPPGVALTAAGLTFDNHHVTADSGLGLPAGWFTFVTEANFLSRNLPADALAANEAAVIFSRSLGVNNYYISNQKVINLGPGQLAAPALAGLRPGTPVNKSPARPIVPPARPQFAPEQEAAPLALASAAPVENVGSERPNPPTPPSPEVTIIGRHQHHALAADYAGLPARTETSHWTPPPPMERESSRSEQPREEFHEAVNTAPSRETPPAPPRPEPSSTATSSKSGK